ncbi:DUF5988 family protein [Dactylosporangium sp. CA-152071]|uniref:DUF5988 family protein n=1 Tax=Dactylosporangium sp. CA-152071 TaxID=3239933 RepID=UPI003D9092C1
MSDKSAPPTPVSAHAVEGEAGALDVLSQPDAPVEVRLEGGPASFPAELRRQLARPDDEKIKVQYKGGHEHFERRQDEAGSPVYVWTGRTFFAE